MKDSEKIKYVPPTVEVNPVALDANIALQSPLKTIDAEPWADEDVVTPDTGDIFIAI